MKDLTTGSPANLILRFSIPILLGNMLQLFYTLTDTKLIGVYLGDDALAAVGAVTVITSLFTGFFIGAANGFAIMTARKFGAKEYVKINSSFAGSVALGLLIAVPATILSLIFLTPVLSFLNVPSSLFEMSAGYIKIIICGFTVTILYNVLLSSVRALGDSLTPLMILILSVVLNIAGDVLMLAVFHTGAEGPAAATVSAQLIALIICGIYIHRKYPPLRLKLSAFKDLSRPMIMNMLTSGISMGLMNSLIGIGSLILQTAVNGLGAAFIVAQSAARRITEVLMSVFVAVGHTMATYTSQNLGANRPERIRDGMNAGYKITCLWCIAVFAIVYLFAGSLVSFITDSTDPVMIDAAVLYLRIDCILYFLVAIIFVLRHSLQGIGDRITPLISSGIEMVGKIILTFTLVPLLGYLGVIFVEPIVWIVMIIPLIVRIRKWKRSYSLM